MRDDLWPFVLSGFLQHFELNSNCLHTEPLNPLTAPSIIMFLVQCVALCCPHTHISDCVLTHTSRGIILKGQLTKIQKRNWFLPFIPGGVSGLRCWDFKISGYPRGLLVLVIWSHLISAIGFDSIELYYLLLDFKTSFYDFIGFYGIYSAQAKCSFSKC